MWKLVIPVLLPSSRCFSKFRVTGEPSCALWSSRAPEGWALPSHESKRQLKQSEHFEENKVKAVGESPGWNPSLCHRYFDNGTSVTCRKHHCAVCQRLQSPSVLSVLSQNQPSLQTVETLLLKFYPLLTQNRNFHFCYLTRSLGALWNLGSFFWKQRYMILSSKYILSSPELCLQECCCAFIQVPVNCGAGVFAPVYCWFKNNTLLCAIRELPSVAESSFLPLLYIWPLVSKERNFKYIFWLGPCLI